MTVILILGPSKGGACTIQAPPNPPRRVEPDLCDNAPVIDQRGLCNYRACVLMPQLPTLVYIPCTQFLYNLQQLWLGFLHNLISSIMADGSPLKRHLEDVVSEDDPESGPSESKKPRLEENPAAPGNSQGTGMHYCSNYYSYVYT